MLVRKMSSALLFFVRGASGSLKDRFLSTASVIFNKAVASFDDVKAVKSKKDALLVDVREPSELQETGVLPSSINIPLDQVEAALKLSPEEFEHKYGTPKPQSSSPIIFSCKMGKRSATAQDIAEKLGFKNTRNYLGGWVEWEEKNK